MNIIVAGVIASLAFSFYSALVRSTGKTTFNIVEILSDAFGDSSNAKKLGWAAHLIIGIILASFYPVFLEGINPVSSWFKGAVIGLAQGVIFGVFFMPLIADISPAIKSGKSEKPGVFAISMGPLSSSTIVIGSIIFGIVVGTLVA